MNESLDRYGVVGHPIAHSWSPFIHGLFARQTGQALEYKLFDVQPGDFWRFVHEFSAQGGRGLNVTVPHKRAASELTHTLSPRARISRAVNTLSFANDRILGDNTDGVGLVRDLCENLGLKLARRRILIAGAGGAARGVLVPLLELEPIEIVVASRNAARAHELVADFAALGAVRGCGLQELSLGSFDLIINATSAGLAGEVPPIPTEAVSASTTCYDMAYAKTPTAFVRWAREQGCERAVPGWGMLVEQAAESFHIWRGVRPQTAPVLEALARGG
jgi:shikimate dehydrogenase